MSTYLDVPFRDKAEAKARGARWDGALKKWFVPAGRDLGPFASWLPADPSRPPLREVGAPGAGGVSLSQLLAGVAGAVSQVFRQGVWTTAEVVRLDGDSHVYLELAERDAGGTLLAKARAVVWSRDVPNVLGTFQAASGVRLAAGVKVLVRARPDVSAQYGLTLHVDAIDPAYTLGDLEATKSRIRERLKAESLYDRNRQLPAPFDYRALLVVSPPRAAGLGDFARDADRLQRRGVCEAVYAHSRFEGEGAPASIREAIEAALATWAGLELPDAIVLIRGGGAVNDLAWLNDYDLARFVCLSPIPVLTGIGHERDSTVLDEVAHRRFDTPSKVIAGIEALIVKRVREAQAAFDEATGLALRQLRTAGAEVDALDASIRRQAAATIARARAGVRIERDVLERQARRGLAEAQRSTAGRVADIRSGASVLSATGRAKTAALMAQVRAGADHSVRDARRRAAEARQAVVARSVEATRRRQEQVRGLVEGVARDARKDCRGATAAEATFREVVAQGPEKTLARGFAVVQDAGGRIVARLAEAGEARDLAIRFNDGAIDVSVKRRRKKTP